MEEKVDIREKLQEGHVRAILILEVLGKPSEHVRKTLDSIILVMKNDKNIIILNKKSFRPKKVKDSNLFSAFIEVEILAKNLIELFGICFDYMPSSIEIIEPKDLKFQLSEVNAIANDLAARLHKAGEIAKRLNVEKQILQAKLNDLFKGTPIVNLKEVKLELGDSDKEEAEAAEKEAAEEEQKQKSEETGKQSETKAD